MADHLVGGLHCAEAADLAAPFVLGALEPTEAEAVRAHLAGCPEAHPEFAELGSVVPALFETVEPMEPPASLKGRILAVAAADTQRAAEAQPAAPDTQRAADAQRAADTERAADAQRSSRWASLFRRPVWAGVAMAATVAAVVVGAAYLNLRSERDALTVYRNGVAAVLQQAANPGTQIAVLAGPDGSRGPTGLAAVTADGGVRIVMHDLAPTSQVQFYEAWLIAGDSAPVPIGGFAVPANGVATFATFHQSMGSGVTVALTLESGPEPATPTLPIIAAGTARDAS